MEIIQIKIEAGVQINNSLKLFWWILLCLKNCTTKNLRDSLLTLDMAVYRSTYKEIPAMKCAIFASFFGLVGLEFFWWKCSGPEFEPAKDTVWTWVSRLMRERISPCLDLKEMLSKLFSLVPCKWLELASDYHRHSNHYSLKLYFSSVRQMSLTVLLLLFCKLSFTSHFSGFNLFKYSK